MSKPEKNNKWASLSESIDDRLLLFVYPHIKNELSDRIDGGCKYSILEKFGTKTDIEIAHFSTLHQEIYFLHPFRNPKVQKGLHLKNLAIRGPSALEM